MATLRGHDIDGSVTELILANCDVNFTVSVLYSDFASTINLERFNQAKISYWTVAMFCACTCTVLMCWGGIVADEIAFL